MVYSAESLARTLRRTFSVCQAALFGYGKVGRSIARELRCRNLHLELVETDALRQVEALSHGFKLVNKAEALGRAELVICSTGNGSSTSPICRPCAPAPCWPRSPPPTTNSPSASPSCPGRAREVCPHVLA